MKKITAILSKSGDTGIAGYLHVWRFIDGKIYRYYRTGTIKSIYRMRFP